MVRTSILLAIFAGMIALGSTSPAQDLPGIDRDARRDLGSALRILRPLIREDPERALRMLEGIAEEYPMNSQVLIMLGELYQNVGKVDSAKAAYEKCLRIHPMNTKAGASLGMLYIQNDQQARGEQVFRDLLLRTSQSAGTYRVIGSTLSNAGYFDLAMRVYEEGRRVNDGNYVLTIDIAYLHKLMGDNDAALREYITLVETVPKQYQLAKNKILELVREADSGGETLLDSLRAHTERPGPQREQLHDILALAYLEKGMLEDALEMALIADSKTSKGTILFNLADETMQAYRRQTGREKTRYFHLGLRAIEAFLDRHADSPQVPRAKLMLVDLLSDLAAGHVTGPKDMQLEMATIRSVDALDWLIDTFPGTEYAEEAYLKKGDLVFKIRRKPREALKIYQAGMAKARFYPTDFAERLGRVYLVLDEFDDAEKHFARLVNSNSQPLREAGIFYTGLLYTFMHEYESARDTLTALAESNPSSQFTNDAIELSWAIEEGLQGDQAVLAEYVDALKADVAGDTATAIKNLESISDLPADLPLRGRALILLGDAYKGSHQYDRALETYERFTRDYPSDVLVPNVKQKIGEVYDVGYGDTELALETYENILLMYPHYIFLDEIRGEVTRLRKRLGVQ